MARTEATLTKTQHECLAIVSINVYPRGILFFIEGAHLLYIDTSMIKKG
jgi:hypothetical protein